MKLTCKYNNLFLKIMVKTQNYTHKITFKYTKRRLNSSKSKLNRGTKNEIFIVDTVLIKTLTLVLHREYPKMKKP